MGKKLALKVSEGRTPSYSETIMTEIIFPNDTNPMGIVQGGRIVQLMDTAAAVCAQIHSGRIAVTASIDEVSFFKPACLGDVLCIRARVTRVFNTSMEIYTEVHSKRLPDMMPFLSHSAYFTFVALDSEQKPVVINPLIPETGEERKTYNEALVRKMKRMKK